MYNGLFIITSPNRYDKANAGTLCGPPGLFLKETLAQFNYNWEHAQISANPHAAIPAGTKKLLLLGNDATKYYQRADARLDISAKRGYVSTLGRCEILSTFSPVDCTDVVDHEVDDDDDGDDNDKGNGKDSAPTLRSNYRFWFLKDLEKLLTGARRTVPDYETIDFDPSDDNLLWLSSLRGDTIFFDIETHPPTDTIQCFAFSTTRSPVFSVSCYDWNGSSNPALVRILVALQRALQNNRVVIHNAGFDLPFLFLNHGIVFGRDIYCTMVAQHRLYPEAEKSLAHVISLNVNAPYHKNEGGTFTPHNRRQYQTLLDYNAKDVATLRAVYRAQQAEINKDVGLQTSVSQAMSSLYDYFVMALTGMELDTMKLAAQRRDVAAQVAQARRVFQILTHVENPGSSQQIGEWLYAGLNYPVLAKTESGAAATDTKTIYRLLQKYPRNIALKLLIHYKEISKLDSSLNFEWFYMQEKRI